MAKKIPMRMCVGCREMREKRQLVRVVRTEEGSAAVDLTGKANGRGAYVCASAECLKKAVKSRAIDRALDIKVDPGIIDRLADEISKREPLKEELSNG